MPMKNQPYQFFRERLLYWAADITWVWAVSAHRPVLCLGWLHYRHPVYLKEPLETTWKDSYGLLGSITFTHTFEANSLWIKFIKSKKRIGAPPHLSCRMFWQCSGRALWALQGWDSREKWDEGDLHVHQVLQVWAVSAAGVTPQFWAQPHPLPSPLPFANLEPEAHF